MKKEKAVNVYDNALNAIHHIHERLGCVGKNQIKNISKHQQVPFEGLIDCVINEGLNLVNYAEGVK